MKHLGFASIDALKQYLRYAEARKLNTSRIIEDCDLRETLKSKNEGRITGEQFQQFLERLIAEANDPLLGLSSALYVRTQSYAILGKIAEQCETLEQVIQRIPVFERLVGDMGITQIKRGSNTIALTWSCRYTSAKVIPHMVDNVLASWTLYARWLTKSHASPRAIRMQKAAPDKAQGKVYDRMFGAAVEFGADRDEIIIDAALLALKPRKDSMSNRDLLEGKARSEMAQLGKTDESFVEQVKRSIEAHLQFGSARKDLIAEEFSCSERQIQRRLAKEGVSYRTLLEDARKQRALRFIADTELNVSEIAYNLGYQDERSFYRSFKKWTGESPNEFRAGAMKSTVSR